MTGVYSERNADRILHLLLQYKDKSHQYSESVERGPRFPLDLKCLAPTTSCNGDKVNIVRQFPPIRNPVTRCL